MATNPHEGSSISPSANESRRTSSETETPSVPVSDELVWHRVQAEIDAYITEEDRNWCGLDEFVIARYVAGECSPEETRRIEAAIEQSDHVRDCIALLQEDDLVQITPIGEPGGMSPSDRPVEIAANAATTMASKTPSDYDVKSTSSSKSPWLLAVTMLVALGVQTWYFRQQLESQTKENSRLIARIDKLKAGITKSTAGENDPVKPSDDQRKLPDSDPSASQYEEPMPNTPVVAEGSNSRETEHKTLKPEPVVVEESNNRVREPIANRDRVYTSFREPLETEAVSKVRERDTRLSIRGLLGTGVPFRTCRYVAEDIVERVPEKGPDGKPFEKTVRRTVMKQVFEDSGTRFVTASVVGLADDDLLALPPIGDLIPQLDEQKSPLVRWAVAEVLRSRQWKDQHPIAEITAKLLQRNDGGNAAAQYVLAGELWGAWPPDDIQIEQGLADKGTFSQWAALYALIQRKTAARTQPALGGRQSVLPDESSPKAAEDVPSTESNPPTEGPKVPMSGASGDDEGTGNAKLSTLPRTFSAPSSSDGPSAFDLRVLKRANEFLASKEKSQVRLAAVYLIGEYGRAAKDSEPHLVRILEESNHSLESRWAAYALGQIRANSRQALSQLVKSLDDTNPKVSPAAAFALTLILENSPNPADAENARPKLRTMLQASDPVVRHWGAYALQKLNH